MQSAQVVTLKSGIDWSGHFQAARRKIANPQDARSLALVTGVLRQDKRLKFWLGNSCTNAPEHQAVKRGIC